MSHSLSSQLCHRHPNANCHSLLPGLWPYQPNDVSASTYGSLSLSLLRSQNNLFQKYESDYVYKLSKSFIDFPFLLRNIFQTLHRGSQGFCMIWLPLQSSLKLMLPFSFTVLAILCLYWSSSIDDTHRLPCLMGLLFLPMRVCFPPFAEASLP